jgi:hypothetical protein
MKNSFVQIGYKNQRRNLRELKQVGSTTIPVDATLHALLPGKRVSETRKVYWETRKNRTDAKGSKL